MAIYNKNFFTGNRKKLIESFPDTLIVIAANSLVQQSADIAYPFKQDKNFWYLTGINEPDLLLVIDASIGESMILLSDQNEYQKEWDGHINNEQLSKQSGIDKFSTIDELSSIVKKVNNKNKKIGYLKPAPERIEPYGFYANPARRNLESRLRGSLNELVELVDLRLEIAKHRSLKQPEEIESIQQAIDVTDKTLAAIRLKLKNFTNEKDIERAISAGFFKYGSDGYAFEPIVASGINASTIHYTSNNSKLAANDIILLDIGAEVDGYASDISRSWSLSGKPSVRQKELHAGVLQMQDFAFNQLKPGVYLRDYQNLVEIEAKKIMKKLRCSTHDKPFPHGVSHFMGLDVHDAGDYDAPLSENMVLTVEPGIYLQDEGMGLRIEDDIILTKTGIRIMSSKIPSYL